MAVKGIMEGDIVPGARTYIPPRAELAMHVAGSITAKLSILAAIVMLCAPLPKRGEVQFVPGTRGRIRDSLTGNPVQGASVTVDDRPETVVLTEDDGRFHIQEIRKTYCVVFMSPGGAEGYLPSTGRIRRVLSVRHPCYEELRVFIREHLDWTPSNTNFGGSLFMSDILVNPKK